MNWRVLAHFGALLPQAWDAVIPQGPRSGASPIRKVGFGVEAGLNPQPLPPEPPPELFLGAVMVNVMAAREIILGGGRVERFVADIDDWCGTGWPRRWPKPPKPHGWDAPIVFAGAAAACAALAAQYDHAQDIQGAFVKAAEQLSEQASR